MVSPVIKVLDHFSNLMWINANKFRSEHSKPKSTFMWHPLEPTSTITDVCDCANYYLNMQAQAEDFFQDTRYRFSIEREGEHGLGIKLCIAPNQRNILHSLPKVLTCVEISAGEIKEASFAKERNGSYVMACGLNLDKLKAHDFAQAVDLDEYIDSLVFQNAKQVFQQLEEIDEMLVEQEADGNPKDPTELVPDIKRFPFIVREIICNPEMRYYALQVWKNFRVGKGSLK